MIITLDGRTLDSFGLVPNPGHAYPAAPATRDRLLTIPGRHGVYDFGADLGERLFKFPLTFAYETERTALQSRIREFVAFLFNGYGRPRNIELRFTYDPDKYYTVRVLGALDMERIFSTGRFTLPLVAADPISRLIVNAGDIVLDTDLLIDSDIRLNDVYAFSVTGAKSVEVNNFGTMNAESIIEVIGSFTTLTISSLGWVFTYNEAIANQVLSIDSERMTVKVGAVNKLGKMGGSFPVLSPGINNITISGTGLSASVSFIFKPKFI